MNIKKTILIVPFLVLATVAHAAYYSVNDNAIWQTLPDLSAYDGVEIASGKKLTLAPASGVTMSFTKVIAGDGELAFAGAGILELRGENSFRGQFTINGTGEVHAYTDGAFGSPEGLTYHFQTSSADATTPQSKIYLHGITTAEPFALWNNDKKRPLYSAKGTTNTLTGVIDVRSSNQADIYAQDDSVLNIRGGIVGSGSNQIRFSTGARAKIYIKDTPISTTMWNCLSGNGHLYFDVAGNAGGYCFMAIVCDCDFVFDGADLKVGISPNGNGLHLDLNGHPQRLASLLSKQTATDGNQWITSLAKAFCHVACAADGNSGVPFKDKAGLFYEGSGTMTTYAAHPSSGDIVVSGGRVNFATAAKWVNAENVAVIGSGVLSLSSIGQIGSQANLSLSDNGVLVLPDDATMTVTTLMLDGNQVQADTYGVGALNGHLQGSGAQLKVLQGPAAKLLKIESDTTWKTIPDLSQYDGVEIAESKTLTLSPASGITMSIMKPLSGAGNLAFNGAGVLELRCDNTFAGTFTINGSGEVHAYADGSFGSVTGGTLHNQVSRSDAATAQSKLYLHGITTPEPITIFNNDKQRPLYAAENTVNVLQGLVSVGSSNQADIYALAGATLTLKGGITGTATDNSPSLRLSTETGAKIIVEDKPNAAWLFNSLKETGEIHFNAANNRGGYFKYVLDCGTDFALDGANLRFKTDVNAAPKVRMNGHSQRITTLNSAAENRNSSLIQSASPATLYVNGSDTSEVHVPLLGYVSLCYEGTGSMKLCENLTTTGGLSVTSGTVNLLTGKTWDALTDVTVSGTGVLDLASDRQLRDIPLTLSGAGKLKLPANCRVRVSKLVVDGQELKGSFTTNDPKLGGHIEGAGGTIYVKGTCGMIVIFR